MNSTIVGLVAAIAVLSGGLGFSMTGMFDDQNLLTSNLPSTGFLLGQVEIEARNADGEIFAYRLSDNEVVDDGEQCILKLLFATDDGTAGRGDYASGGATGACTGILQGAWNVIAIGTCNATGDDDCTVTHDLDQSGADQDLLVNLGNETSGVYGLARGMATSITWNNGSGTDATSIVLAKTFTTGTLKTGTTHVIGESGLFNSTVTGSQGMLARQMFTDVTLGSGDSITVTWTFTVGN